MNKARFDQAIGVLSRAEQTSDEHELAAIVCNTAMGSTHREALKQLVEKGPVWDGDVISKSARDDLLEAGLATRVCCKGEQGFTAATYRGWTVLTATA